MSRSYVTAEQLARVAETLSERDWLIVQTMACVKVATARQLERLHFDSDGSASASARHRRRVLARLVDLRVLARLDRRIGGVRAGSAGFVYGFDVVGQRLPGFQRGDGISWRRPWTPGISFLQHRLAITELYVWLVEAERTGMGELLDFVAEPDCWRSFSGPGGGRVVLKPDAFVRVAAEGYEYVWFVEVDRGAESRPTLKAKCQRYIAYWLSGREDTRNAVFPAVIWLVPNGRRADALAEVLDQLPPDSRVLFRIGLFDQAVGILHGRGYADPAA